MFRNISQNSGLSSATEPTTFSADGDGFMWVGTQSGLLRWDGYNFKRYLYDPKQPGALPDNYVVSLHTDPKGRLWVGTNIAGLALYDPARDRFIRYGDPSGRIAGAVNAIVDDGAGGLWIGSDKGLSHLDPVSGKVVPVAQSDLSAEAVNGLFEDSSGLLWVATPQGLFRRTAQGGFIPINLPHRDPGPLETTSVFKDSRGRIWIGTQRHGAYMLSPGAAAPVPVTETEVGPSSLSSETVETVAEIAPGEIWLGTQGHGIVAVDQAMHTHRIVRDLSVSASLCDNTVLNLYRGPSGLIWVATNQAIDIYNPAEAGFVTVFGPSSRPNGLTDGDIQSIAVMPDGHIWLGLGVGGVDILSPSSRLVAHLAPDPRRPDTALPPAIPDAITSTVNGQVYLGTTSGLYRVDERTHHAAAVPLPTPGHQRVRTLLWRDGALWVGERGLTRIVVGPDGAPRGPEAHLERGLGSLQVTALEPGPDGAIWVGTHAGLNLVDARMRILQTVPTLSDGHGVSPGGITSLLTDRHGRLWVSSTGGGIDILMGHDSQGQWRFHHLGAEQHLPDPNVDKLLLAPDGFVWASTDDGLAKIDPQTLTIAPRQGRDGVYLTSYWNGSGAVTAQGDVLFGGVGGMTVVRPSAMPPWLYQPSIVVTSAERGGKPLLAETFDLRTAKAPLSIGPEANGFRFEFAALDYSAPSYNRYAYQLVGYDTHWIETDAGHRIAAYTNLWPGRYTLRLRGSNREGIWTPRTLDIPIIVLPHWYQTGWFYGLALLSAVLAIAAIVLWRTAGLRRQRRDLERVVADRTAELREQTELALAANQAKSAFLAMMSHELRTPMNGVLGMARAMKMSQLNPEQERQLDMIVRSGDSLMTILNDILDLSKIEAGKLELEIAPFDLIELGQSAYDLWNDAASRKGVALVYHVDPATPRWVEGDPTRVRQIVLNLVSNALKFTLEGEVRVEIGPVGERIQIRVSDTGIGIPPAQQSKLFQSFSQADATTTRRFGGTGLGLSICKQLAESMGGGIQLYSIEGEGSTFTVDLVLPPAEAPVSSAAANAGESECDPDQPEGPPLEGLSLLVVDDNPTNLAVAGALMGAFGARTITANDGVQALEQLGQADFDVVLMDLQMPRMNGAEALSHIRAGAAGPRDIPVIALTAGVMAGETERLLGLGFDDVQPKPIIPGDLLRSILTVLAARADQTAPEAAAQRG